MPDPLAEIVEIGARALCEAGCEFPKCGCHDRPRDMQRVLSALTAAGYAIIPREPNAEIVAAIWRAAGAPDQEQTEAIMKSWLQGHKAMIAVLSPPKGSE